MYCRHTRSLAPPYHNHGTKLAYTGVEQVKQVRRVGRVRDARGRLKC